MRDPNTVGPYVIVPLDERHEAKVRAHFRELTRNAHAEFLDPGFEGPAATDPSTGLVAVVHERFGVIGPDGELLGLLQLATTGLTASLQVSVVPAARRQGIGFTLLELAQRIAARRGVTWLIALAHPDNVPMRNLARLAGMRVHVNRKRMLACVRLPRPPRGAQRAAGAPSRSA
jgi:GNAT superfamily N-acetyltransferase